MMTKHRPDRLHAQNVTIKDVAERLGVSHSTVSRALNDHRHISEDMKDRVREAAADLGYVVNASARKLRRAESNLIALIVPDVLAEMFTFVAKSLSAQCFKAGYQLVLCATDDDPTTELRHVEALCQARAIGVVIIPSPRLLEQTAALLKPIPTVQVSRRHPLLSASSVSADGERGVADAVRHLAQLGHQRIAYVGLTTDRSTGVERLAGYRRGLQENGLPFDESWVRLGPTKQEFGRAAVTSLIRQAKPLTAIVFGTADVTYGGLDALRHAKIEVPAAISILGFGDPAWFKLQGPGISTVSVSLSEMADAAISVLLRQISAHDAGTAAEPPASIVLDPFLILRGTTARPPTSGST
jgi:DNA-binding LacI/PurR family transcriptional regulator